MTSGNETGAAGAAPGTDDAADPNQGGFDGVGAPEPSFDEGGPQEAPTVTVEDLLELIERLTAERDGHLDARARLQAEFDNYRKRVANQQHEQLERAAETLVTKLLPVLDAGDAAVAHGAAGAAPLAGQLAGVLEREGLQRIAPVGEPFDPTYCEAVIHEDGDGPTSVVDVLRAGYLWKGRVLRPAMVKVRG